MSILIKIPCVFPVRIHWIHLKIPIISWSNKCLTFAKLFGHIFSPIPFESIRYRGVGRVCFLPPLFCPTKFVKSSDQFFERKARRRRKNLEVHFFKKLTFLGKFNGFLAVFSGSTMKNRRAQAPCACRSLA